MTKKKKFFSFQKQQFYQKLLTEISKRIQLAQYEALKGVNRQLIELYWDIGRIIVQRQKEEKWGKSVVEQLSKDLQNAFPGIRGFSIRNLWNMRDFYLSYRKVSRLSSMVKEIGWTHNVVIMTKCKEDLEKEFYIRMAAKFGWTKTTLIQHIENNTYESTLTNQTNFEASLPAELLPQAKLAVKDEYTFDFLELGDEYKERELEKGLVLNIEPFLRKMGGMFTFMGSQYRLEVKDKEYFIDLLLYHRKLRCLVAIELKIGEFLPEYVGKMQFYLALLDDRTRLEEENLSIGIILCKDKDKTVVEYALRESNKPIGVASFRFSKQRPKKLQKDLPSPQQVEKLLEGIHISYSKIAPQKQALPETTIAPRQRNFSLTSTQKKAIQHIRKKGKTSNQEYQQVCGVTKRQASRELKQLVDWKILIKKGTRGRGVHYVLKEN